MPNTQRPRGIRESDEYVEQKAVIIAQFASSARAFEELHESFTYTLAREPGFYPFIVAGLGVRGFRTRPGMIPALFIWYTYDDQFVDLLFVEVVEDGEET